MATYLKTLTPTPVPPAAALYFVQRDVKAVLAKGEDIHSSPCTACHGEQGQGYATTYPALAGSHTLNMPSPANAIRIVLNGGFPPSTVGNPRPYGMPLFAHGLDDEEVAAVLSLLRTGWGNQEAMVSTVAVKRLRSVPQD